MDREVPAVWGMWGNSMLSDAFVAGRGCISTRTPKRKTVRMNHTYDDDCNDKDNDEDEDSNLVFYATTNLPCSRMHSWQRGGG